MHRKLNKQHDGRIGKALETEPFFLGKIYK